MKKLCSHNNFKASVEVHRIQPIKAIKGAPPSHYSADIKIECAECGQSFKFLCSRRGLRWNEPTVGICGDELRVPIHPNDGSISTQPKFQAIGLYNDITTRKNRIQRPKI